MEVVASEREVAAGEADGFGLWGAAMGEGEQPTSVQVSSPRVECSLTYTDQGALLSEPVEPVREPRRCWVTLTTLTNSVHACVTVTG